VLQAYFEMGEFVQRQQASAPIQQEGEPSASAESAPSSSSPGAQVSAPDADSSANLAGLQAAEKALGMPPQELVKRLMANPDMLRRVSNPKVLAALQEIAQSPWKVVKYLLNQDVMAVLLELKDVLQDSKAGNPKS